MKTTKQTLFIYHSLRKVSYIYSWILVQFVELVVECAIKMKSIIRLHNLGTEKCLFGKFDTIFNYNKLKKFKKKFCSVVFFSN